MTFFTMLTGWPPATGIAAPTRMHVLVEQPRRPEVGRHHEDDDRACCRQLGGLAAASLAERIQKSAWRPSEAMLLSVAAKGVRWTRATSPVCIDIVLVSCVCEGRAEALAIQVYCTYSERHPQQLTVRHHLRTTRESTARTNLSIPITFPSQ